MNVFLEWLHSLRPEAALFWFLIENLAVFVSAGAAGYFLLACFGKRRVALAPSGIEKQEIFYTISTILLNTLITFAGCRRNTKASLKRVLPRAATHFSWNR